MQVTGHGAAGAAGAAVAAGAAFFDLDKTIIAGSSTLAFGRPFYRGGLVGRGAVLRSAYAQLVVVLAGADEARMERMRDYLADLCRGWPAERVQAIVDETLHQLISPLVHAEAVELIREHQRSGRPVVVVSSSGEEVVAPIAAMVGADHVVSTRMQVEGGRYTGAIERYVYGPRKATEMAALAAEHGWSLAASFAYSDSATDLPMLEAVGHPVAVNPDRALRRVAAARGWPVLAFERPVPLLPRPSRAGTGTAPLLVLAGALLVARRRVRTSAAAPRRSPVSRGRRARPQCSSA